MNASIRKNMYLRTLINYTNDVDTIRNHASRVFISDL
jgi:hypothetical protein